jgi:hypothetical protein
MRDFLCMPTVKSLKRRIENVEKEQERKRRRTEAAKRDSVSNDEVVWDSVQNKFVIVRAPQ